MQHQEKSTNKKIIIKSRQGRQNEKKEVIYRDLIPSTRLEISGRITKIFQRKKGKDVVFQVLAPETGYFLNCSWRYFSPIMEGDAIFACGVVDESGEMIIISRPPFITPCNDDDSIREACFVAIGRGNVYSILSEIKKMLRPNEDLSTRLDLLSIAYRKHGERVLTHLVQDSLKQDTGTLLRWWYKKRCLRRLYLLDLTDTEINNAGYDPVELYYICLENPFRIPSITIEKCETILLRINKKPSPEDKYCGKIMREIRDYLNEKWTYIPRNIIEGKYVDFKKYEKRLSSEYGIYIASGYVALEGIVRLEQKVAKFISFLLKQNKWILSQGDLETLNSILEEYHCDKDQKKAIQTIIENPITIVTGGAGTGKTTLLRALIRFFELKGIPFLLTSFTGKAVSRIKEVLPQTRPTTFHRILGKVRTIEGELISGGYLIIDEVSMLETKLFYDFIQKYPVDEYKYRVVIIGDLNQLPPIGWGCFFQQIFKSGKVPTCYLTICHRTEGVGILTNARLILEGSFPESTPDFQLCFGKTPLQIIQEHHLTIESVRILTPFVETVNEQNKQLQSFFCNGLPYLEDNKGRRWFLQDRVMMTKNNYTIDAMNGQEGFVVFFDPNEEGIYVAFNRGNVHFFTFRSDDLEKALACYPPASNRYLDLDTCEEITPGASRKKKFRNKEYRICSDDGVLFYNMEREVMSSDEAKEFDEDSREIPPVDHLIHSYALTIHKAQGSEWDYVIVLLPEKQKNSVFITRNLLYTAITRARKGVFCLGNRESWVRGILNLGKEPKQLLAHLISD